MWGMVWAGDEVKRAGKSDISQTKADTDTSHSWSPLRYTRESGRDWSYCVVGGGPPGKDSLMEQFDLLGNTLICFLADV